ncbi:hypothetical protein DFH09DRAFT_309700 [Mycena vulgaris]|nr:hypothetical protein DFH09DRAFT_309700 [Mycena vulgaris]
MAHFATVLGLLAFICSSALCEQLRPRHTQLRPLQPLNIIPGLLNRASSTCSGCPLIGAVCCSGGETCCPTAHRCCSDGGCCQLSEFCDTVDGIKGCCPVGRTCTGAPPVTTADHDTTTRTGTTKTATSTTTTTSFTSTPTTTKSAGTTSTHTALSSVPTAPSGSQNVVVDMSASALVASGRWESTTSSCNSSAQSKTVASDGTTASEYSTLFYSFQGTAIYMKSASINAHYTVALDTDVTEYGGTSSTGQTDAPPNCTFGWWRDNLDAKLHTVEIIVYGASSSLVSARAVQPWAFELHNFIITKTSSGSSSASGGSGSTSGNGTSTNASLSSLILLILGFWAALILL